MTGFAINIDLSDLTYKLFGDPKLAFERAEKMRLIFAEEAAQLEVLSDPQLVALYNVTATELNKLTGVGIAEVKRFAAKDVGAKRLWNNFSDLNDQALAKSAREAQIVAARPIKKEARKDTPKRSTGTNLAPMSKAYPCRAGSKQAMIVDLLSRPPGATFAELHEAMNDRSAFPNLKPWAEVTTRSAINWDVNKVKGYGVRTVRRGNTDVYHLVLPAGLTAPLPHLPRTTKK